MQFSIVISLLLTAGVNYRCAIARRESRARVFLTMSSTLPEFSRGEKEGGRADRESERELYAPRAFFTRQSRSIFRVVAVSLVPLLRVCFCLAEEIPRDRVRRQLHIDRILENRQFRSARRPHYANSNMSVRKTVDSRVARHPVPFRFQSELH